MLVCVSAWIAAFRVLSPFEVGVSGGGEEEEPSVCVLVLVITFSTCVWSASGAPGWIRGSEALRKKLDYKSVTTCRS